MIRFVASTYLYKCSSFLTWLNPSVKPRVFFGQLMTCRLSPGALGSKFCSFNEWCLGGWWKTEEIQTCTTCIMHHHHQPYEFHKIPLKKTVTALTCHDIHTGASSNLPPFPRQQQNAHTHTPNAMMIELGQRPDLPNPPAVLKIVRITLLRRRVNVQYKH